MKEFSLHRKNNIYSRKLSATKLCEGLKTTAKAVLFYFTTNFQFRKLYLSFANFHLIICFIKTHFA